jgi:hypothetical protein
MYAALGELMFSRVYEEVDYFAVLEPTVTLIGSAETACICLNLRQMAVEAL